MTLLAVPNISEGRRPQLVKDIAGSDGALLDMHIDPDHNRAVLTYGGTADEVSAASTQMIDRAVDLLDINQHDGVHPRFGVVDVLPVVPYGATEADAEDVADRIAMNVPMPVYRYTDDLPALRRRLRRPHHAHPTAGVICIGVRPPLIAFNVNLRADLTVAKRIVPLLRKLDGVRALAFELPSRGLVQVSMNLTNPDVAGPKAVYDRIAGESPVVDAEIVGLVPGSIIPQLESIPLRGPARTIEDALRR